MPTEINKLKVTYKIMNSHQGQKLNKKVSLKKASQKT